MKTNGARLLESLGIDFVLREYEVDPNDLSAIAVAKKVGMPAEQVFKTLLTTGGQGSGGGVYVFAVIPGDAELVPLKEVQPLTGYIRGGVTVFGAKKSYPVYVDETAILFDTISVSAGARGTQLILSPDDYLKAATTLGAPAELADLTKSAAPEGHASPKGFDH